MPLCPKQLERAEMTFKEFLEDGLKKGTFGDSPESDFANDVRTDKNFRDFKTWADLEMYIVFHGACREAVRAAKTLFRKWECRDKQKENQL